MVFYTLLNFALESGIWTIQKSFDLGCRIIYGKPKTDMEKVCDELKNLEQVLHKDLVIITNKLEKLESELEEVKNENMYLKSEINGVLYQEGGESEHSESNDFVDEDCINIAKSGECIETSYLSGES